MITCVKPEKNEVPCILLSLDLSDLKFVCRININLMTSVLDGLVCFLTKILLHCMATTSNVSRANISQ